MDEFLLKNDPCRAKGRTNIELREPLAEGVSQSIAAFRSKSPFRSGLGPITKVSPMSSSQTFFSRASSSRSEKRRNEVCQCPEALQVAEI